MAVQQMTEAQAVNFVRNALVVAGQEMGDKGDHWPVIKSTVLSIMKDWENLQVENNVDAELKIHLYALLNEMETKLPECTEAERTAVIPKLKELREVFDAYFSTPAPIVVDIDSEDMPIHIKRAKIIMDTLEAKDE